MSRLFLGESRHGVPSAEMTKKDPRTHESTGLSVFRAATRNFLSRNGVVD